jgi:hypothetical protein
MQVLAFLSDFLEARGARPGGRQTHSADFGLVNRPVRAVVGVSPGERLEGDLSVFFTGEAVSLHLVMPNFL